MGRITLSHFFFSIEMLLELVDGYIKDGQSSYP